MNKDILWFKDINKNMIPDVGGKGANLGEMENAGFPVPPGFVITAHAYFRNMTENKLLKKLKMLKEILMLTTLNNLMKNLKSLEILFLTLNYLMQ